MNVVIDTSALIEVLVNEQAPSGLVAATQGATLLAPRSVHWEVGNAFSTMFKRKAITPERATTALGIYGEIPLRFMDVQLGHAMELSAQLNIYAYDAYVIACAINQQAPILTLDATLAANAQRVGVRILEVPSV